MGGPTPPVGRFWALNANTRTKSLLLSAIWNASASVIGQVAAASVFFMARGGYARSRTGFGAGDSLAGEPLALAVGAGFSPSRAPTPRARFTRAASDRTANVVPFDPFVIKVIPPCANLATRAPTTAVSASPAATRVTARSVACADLAGTTAPVAFASVALVLSDANPRRARRDWSRWRATTRRRRTVASPHRK